MTTRISMLAIDLAKGSFQVCAIGADGACLNAPCFGKRNLRSFGGVFDRTCVRPLSVAFYDATGRFDLSRMCAALGARLSHLPFKSDRAFPAQC